MKKLCALSILCLLLSAPVAQALELADIRDLWRAENYGRVITELLKFRDEDFGKTVEVDYMLATSFCRFPGDDDLGRAYLRNILQSYTLSDENRGKIADQVNHCPEQQQPEQLAFLTSRSTGGGDAGVRGKMFYFVDGPNRALGVDPLEARKEIPAAELQSRKFALGESVEAGAAMKGRLKSFDPSAPVYASEHFVIGSLSKHTEGELQEIARLLEKALNFYVTNYAARVPEIYISVYLVPDAYQLRHLGERLHGLDVASGTIGYSFRNDLSVSAVVQGPYAGTLKHELTHVLVRTSFGDIPPWLDEGLAALYEVSRQEGDLLRGLPNWRGEVLKRYWRGQPGIAELLGMNWKLFDVLGGDMERQAVQHALARYWVLYLQDRDYLPAVYNTYRTRDLRQTTTNPAADAARLVKTATGEELSQLEAGFNRWVTEIMRPVTNQDVAELQERLTSLGYSPGKIDGLAGQNTLTAVKAFQRDNGFEVDGQIDRVLIGRVGAKTGK